MTDERQNTAAPAAQSETPAILARFYGILESLVARYHTEVGHGFMMEVAAHVLTAESTADAGERLAAKLDTLIAVNERSLAAVERMAEERRLAAVNTAGHELPAPAYATVTAAELERIRLTLESLSPWPWRIAELLTPEQKKRGRAIDGIYDREEAAVVHTDSGFYAPFGADAEFIAGAPVLVDRLRATLAIALPVVKAAMALREASLKFDRAGVQAAHEALFKAVARLVGGR